MKLALLGRDGVINVAKPGGVNHRTQLEMIAGSIEAITKLNQSGYTVVLVTHQPGMSRGLLDLDELEAIHYEIISQVEDAGGVISAIFYCPHDEQDRCHCRPPETGLLDAIEMEFDCDTATAIFFYHSSNGTHSEAALAKAKKFRTFACSEQKTLLDCVNVLLSETPTC